MNVPIWETKSHRNPLFSLAAILQDEAGASDWYLPSKEWQEAKFTDVPGTR
jgi:hypothetical protein